MVLGVPWNTQEKDPRVDGEPPLMVIWPKRDRERGGDRAHSEKAFP